MEDEVGNGERVMEFCPKCGTRLVPARKKQGAKTVLLLSCAKCGYKKPPEDAKVAVAPIVIEQPPKESIAVIGKEEQKLRTLPTVKIECPKCGNTLAYVWQVQTRGSDESSTQFFRCTKCSHTFREYS
ncbi:MAG TPA: transcription factor S [Candidatus Bathyarchaeia archaeon]|nr:transcription factor S [Candidatus Bathyarchaeia archaeon]